MKADMNNTNVPVMKGRSIKFSNLALVNNPIATAPIADPIVTNIPARLESPVSLNNTSK